VRLEDVGRVSALAQAQNVHRRYAAAELALTGGPLGSSAAMEPGGGLQSIRTKDAGAVRWRLPCDGKFP
jgi:hypothetical protein